MTKVKCYVSVQVTYLLDIILLLRHRRKEKKKPCELSYMNRNVLS